MRALITHLMADTRRAKFLVDDWPDPPAPAPNQVKVQTVYSGVTNGTERNDLIAGNYATPDSALPRGWGYQNVGRVVEVGADVTSLQVGDLIYSSSDHVEYAVIAGDGLLVKLPPEVEPRHAALFGMASVAMRTCRHADIRMGEQVLVVGAGCIGQIATQIAAVMGGRVTICDIADDRLRLARDISAAEKVVNSSGDGWEVHVKPESFDVVLDVAGVVGMEDKLITAARQRGRVLFIAGRWKIEYTFNLAQIREITIRQNGHFDTSDLANLCRLVARGAVRLGPLVKDIVPVAEARRVYDTLRDEPQKLLGTVFAW